jgi:hypothetical protein
VVYPLQPDHQRGAGGAERRLRDAGKHWAWIFIGLIPLLGSIWLIWLLVQPSSALLA